MTMGCVASAVASREKNKAKVQPVATPKMLRGDLISRGEARQRRSKNISEHHAKSNKHAQVVAYNTMVEKETLSTSTEQSFRSGRGFLISAMATTSTDTNASEQGSCSTVSDSAVRSPILETAPSKIRKDPPNKTATSLPYSVPEEESMHGLSNGDVKGHSQEVVSQARGQDADIETNLNVCDEQSQQRTEDKDNTGENSNSRTDTNHDDCQVKGQDLESKMADGDTDVKKAGRVRFEKHGTQGVSKNEDRKSRVNHKGRTSSVKPIIKGSSSLPPG